GDGPGLQAELARQPHDTPEPCQVRPVPSAARTAGAYPEGHGKRNPALGDSHAGGQNPSASGRHGVGADLRAGLSGLFVRFPAGAIGTPRAARFMEANYGLGWLLVGGSGHPQVLRFDILIPLSKPQVLDLAIPKFAEPSQRGRLVREQIQPPLGIFDDLNGAIVDAIMNPMRRDVQLLGDLR